MSGNSGTHHPRTRPYRTAEIAITATSIVIGTAFVLVTTFGGPQFARQVLLALAFVGIAGVGVLNGVKSHGKDLSTEVMAYVAAGLALLLVWLTLSERILG